MTDKNKISVIIVAGGSGKRMNNAIPKQFMLICGRSVLMKTIEAFSDFDIVLVLPEDQIAYWNELCDKYQFKIPHSIAKGGPTRFHSVKNGLEYVQEADLIAVHDGVRPLVDENVIRDAIKTANKYGSAVPVIELTDSIRELTEDGSAALDRSSFRLVQTPQVFKTEILKKAYDTEFIDIFTDDASIVEYAGYPIHLSCGSRDNIKITHPIDLKIASLIIALQQEQ